MNAEILKEFYERYPQLCTISNAVEEAYNIMENALIASYEKSKKMASK